MCTESFFIVFICSPGRVYRVEPLGAYVGNDRKASTVPPLLSFEKRPPLPGLAEPFGSKMKFKHLAWSQAAIPENLM